MLYLTGNKKGKLLGVADTDDNVEEFYTKEFLLSTKLMIVGLNTSLQSSSFETDCFKVTLVTINGIKGWELKAKKGVTKFRNESKYLGYPVISLKYCFRYYSALEIDISEMDTSNVVDMTGAFSYCTYLLNLDISSFSTKKVEKMVNMFAGCSYLNSLDLSKFDTSRVTNMRCMFYDCDSLENLNLSSFNTSKVSDMSSMFESCSNLVSLDLSSFSTNSVESMESMFSDCTSLQTLDINNFSVKCDTIMLRTFSGVDNLNIVSLSDLIINKNVKSDIKIVPISLGLSNTKIAKNREELTKYILMGYKGIIACKEF